MANTDNNSLLKKSHIGGFRASDLIGLILMIIPFFISLQSFNTTTRIIPFIPWLTKNVSTSIQPNMITATISVAFYLALILRYNFFKTDNIIDTLISIIRTFLNCWVIAALISSIVSTPQYEKDLIKISSLSFNGFTILVFAVILTWLGMKTIAGYSWILFIFSALNRWKMVSSAMGTHGALFIILFSISLLLQIGDTGIIKEFISDFRVGAKKYSDTMREDIQAASHDVSEKAETVKRFVSANISNYTPVKMHVNKDAAPQPKRVSVNYDALDVNKDGVVDEKDFFLLSKMKDDSTKN